MLPVAASAVVFEKFPWVVMFNELNVVPPEASVSAVEPLAFTMVTLPEEVIVSAAVSV